MTTTYLGSLTGNELTPVSVSVQWSQHLASNNNMREHKMARSSRMKKQREKAKSMLHFNRVKEQLGEQPAGTRVAVRLVRLSTHPLDPGDNHNSSFKAVRDEIAKYFGLNDRYEDQIRFEYLPHSFSPQPSVRAIIFFEPHAAPEKQVKRATVVSDRPIEGARDWQKRGILSSGIVRNRR